MQFVIVGVGQTFNLETRAMEDVLQVQAPDGSLLSVPTTNEAAQRLIQMAMNGGKPRKLEVSMGARVADPFEHGTEVMEDSPYLPAQEAPEDFPDGANIFGGQAAAAPPQSAEGHMDQEDEPEGLVEEEEPPPKKRKTLFQKTQQTKSSPQSRLGVRRNPADRSGVPSYGIAQVDEKGNPVLPAAPDRTMDDEEDPGEQV